MTILYQEQTLTSEIIAGAIEVHRCLGPGLLESTYRTCLGIELESRGLKYVREMPVPLIYKGAKLDCGFRLDFLIEDSVIVELKSVESFEPIYESQLLTYLRLLNKQVGLLINFNELTLKKGIRRCVLGAKDSLSLPARPG